MPGNNEVVLVGRAELGAILDQLKKMHDQAQDTGKAITETGQKSGETLTRQAKKVEQTISSSSGVMRRMLNQLWGDIKALGSLQALEGGLKLSNQFKGAVSESVKLSDTIRRLGPSFGVVKGQFGAFQAALAKGLGEIGASSEEAANALQGLAGFGIKDQAALQNLTTGAVTLGGIGGERGNTQQIASLLAKTLQSQGKNPNDIKAQQALIGEVTAAIQATGKSGSEILSAISDLFDSMPAEFRKSFSPQAMAQLASVATTVGPAGTKAMQEFLSKSKYGQGRVAMEQQGFNVFGKNGELDIKKLAEFVKTGSQRIAGDPRAALGTFGFSPEAAEGLIKLAEQADRVQENLKGLSEATRDNKAAFKSTMGLMDSFRGTINTVKGAFESATQGITQKVTDFLSGAVGDKAASGAIVAGGGLLAAILAGGGLRGIGGALGRGAGGMLKKSAYEGITGEKVTPVYVVNANEIGGGGLGAAAGGLGGVGGMLGKAGLIGGAAFAGYEIGDKLIGPAIEKYTQGKTSEGYEGDAIERLIFKMDQMLGSPMGIADAHNKWQKVQVEINTKNPNLQATPKPSRGGSH